MKDRKKNITQLIFIFILTLFYTLFIEYLHPDEVWNYGFARSISEGLLPYKDFNMIITPLFPVLEGLFMYIFGNNIVVFHIFSAFICTLIFYFLRKDSPNTCYFPYCIMLYFCSLPNYSLMCILFLLVLIYLEEKKSNDILIGVIIGLAFLTKQNVGFALCIPTVMYLKEIKKVLKRIAGFLIPVILMLTYLVYNNILYDFIDYTVLGIGEFAGKNFVIYISTFLIMTVSIIYLIYKLVKTKNIKVLYLLCFWIIAYPLVDPYHIMIPFIPTFAFFAKNINLNKKVINILFYIFICSVVIYSIVIYSGKNYKIPNDTNSFKYRRVDALTVDYINTITNYFVQNGDYTFFIDPNAYVIKLNLTKKIDKYDLLNDGNLGSGGIKKVIKSFDKLCKDNPCTFIIHNPDDGWKSVGQYGEEIFSYVLNNYDKKNEVINFKMFDKKSYAIYDNKQKK